MAWHGITICEALFRSRREARRGFLWPTLYYVIAYCMHDLSIDSAIKSQRFVVEHDNVECGLLESMNMV